MTGLIHIYTGDGKGKTSAAAGLAIRFAGNGGSVLFGQFLKDGSSGELKILKTVPGIVVDSCTERLGFSFAMNEEQKKYAREYYTRYFQYLREQALMQKPGLLVLDEVIGACRCKFVSEAELCDFLRNKPEEMEVVLTGRKPSEALLELADYVSEIKKVKHPFDQGITAREGIEY